MILSLSSYAFNLAALILGIFCLVKGADIFVENASIIARRFNISELVIGLTIVAFGTSAPELAISLVSSLHGQSGMALGNVVGSNIANLALVLGLSVLLHPIAINKNIIKKEFPILIIITTLLLIFSCDYFITGKSNIIGRFESFIFIICIIIYCISSIKSAKQEADIQVEKKKMPPFSFKTILILIGGMIGILFGANLITNSAVSFATIIGMALGIKEELLTNLISLTIIAVGTSLPELVTSITAAKKGQNEIALGNVIGSNIFNILFICGLSGMVLPLPVDNDILTDMFITLGVTLLVFVLSLKGNLKKSSGAILLLFYILYLCYTIMRLFNPNLIINIG